MADTNEQGTGTGTGSTGTGTTPAAGTTTAGTGQQTQQTSQQGTTTGTGQDTSQKPEFKYSEDRSRWIPPHRLSEETTKRTALEARTQQLESQIQALTNTVPKDQKTQKAEEIKAAFYEMFPNAKSLMELSDKQLQQLLQVPDQVQTANQFVSQGWERHAKQMTGTLVSEVSDIIGGKLDAESQADLKLVFGNYIQREVTKAEESGEMSPELQRYLDGDDSLVKEFAKKWSDRWFAPARRQVVSQEVNRAKRVPSSVGRSQQTQVERPKEFKTLEDRLNFLAERGKEAGVQFTK
jgi:hypothetical protein